MDDDVVNRVCGRGTLRTRAIDPLRSDLSYGAGMRQARRCP